MNEGRKGEDTMNKRIKGERREGKKRGEREYTRWRKAGGRRALLLNGLRYKGGFGLSSMDTPEERRKVAGSNPAATAKKS
jgi:hypothetical protein